MENEANNLEKEIQDELRKWAGAGMHPDNISHNFLMMSVTQTVIINLLIEKGILTEIELSNEVDKRVLDTLIQIREAHQSEVLKARLMAGVTPGGKVSPILGPGGKNIKI